MSEHVVFGGNEPTATYHDECDWCGKDLGLVTQPESMLRDLSYCHACTRAQKAAELTARIVLEGVSRELAALGRIR